MYMALSHHHDSFRYGVLGYGDSVSRGGCGDEQIRDLSIIKLGTDFEVAQIQIMCGHNCVLSTMDELKLRVTVCRQWNWSLNRDTCSFRCFGWNQYGQLGYNDTVNRGDDLNEMGR